MRRWWSADNERGVTLVELMVSIGITAVILASLCEIYTLVSREWDRQHNKQQSIVAVSDGLNRLSGYVGQAMAAYASDRFEAGDTLFVLLPADTAHGGVYVPVWDGSNYRYRWGQVLIFYLSDETGSYWNSGDILWAGTVTDWETFPHSIVPDPDWSLYRGSTIGRTAPITYTRFYVNSLGDRSIVSMEIGSTYRAGQEDRFFAQVRNQSIRNEHAL